MNDPPPPKIVHIRKAHDRPAQDVLARLEKLEDSLLADLQDIRAVKAELKKQADTTPGLEKLLDAKTVAELLGENER